MGLQRYGDHHSDRQLLVVRVLHIAESGLTSIRDTKLIPQCMSLLLAQNGKNAPDLNCIASCAHLHATKHSKILQRMSAVGQQRTKSSAPVRLAPERGLQSRSIFLAKSGGVTIFQRDRSAERLLSGVRCA